MRARPHDRFETLARARGALRVAGVDEVGRGPLCGPVMAAAVVFPGPVPEGLADSKLLSPARRRRLAEAIRACADWCVAEASVEEIDRLNVLQASHLAMTRAVAGLAAAPCHILVDGNRLPPALAARATGIVRGDMCSVSIAAASILAKVARDARMVELAQHHPGYGWERNAGYPTREHLAALLDLGPTPHHRRSFRPVHNILYQDHSRRS